MPPCMVRPSAACSITSRLPPSAATGKPAPIAFAITVRSGSIPNMPWAPPGPIRKPVSTSSKITSAPASVASSRIRSRYPGAGMMPPQLPRIGSVITAAIRSPWLREGPLQRLDVVPALDQQRLADGAGDAGRPG